VLAVRVTGSRHLTANASVEECERKIWLLSGKLMANSLPLPRGQELIEAMASEGWFAVWSVGSVKPGAAGIAAPLALYGRLEAISDDETGVEIWYATQPWINWWLGVPLALVVCWFAFRLVWMEALHYLLGTYQGVGLVFLLLFSGYFASGVLIQLHRDELGERLRQALRATDDSSAQ
jgi:hypothetical protein